MALIAFLCVDATSESSTPAKAPPITGSVFEEAHPTLFASKLVYGYGDLINAARDGKIDLKGVDGNPIAGNLGSLDFRHPGYNNGDGTSFAEVLEFYDENRDALEAYFDWSFNQKIVADLKEYYATPSGKGEDNETFLATYRNLQGKEACVYGVVKNRRKKTITVVFRGSMSPTFRNRDWITNLNYRLKSMETPEKIKDKMKGRLQNRVLVHRGFYKYIFDNDNMESDYQRFDNIIDDIKPLMEEGYSLYISGHSLGGALAHLFTFRLAGAGEKYDWVPRPLTCITFGAPMPGTGGYRAAYEQMEKDNLIRCLRIVNVEDPVPALFPISLGYFALSRFRTMKHTGINLRLSNKGIRLEHSSKAGVVTAIRNSLLKPVWMFLFSSLSPHSLERNNNRLLENVEALDAMKLDDLYKDENVVSAKFLAGEVS
jgi:hypothetical protein